MAKTRRVRHRTWLRLRLGEEPTDGKAQVLSGIAKVIEAFKSVLPKGELKIGEYYEEEVIESAVDQPTEQGEELVREQVRVQLDAESRSREIAELAGDRPESHRDEARAELEAFVEKLRDAGYEITLRRETPEEYHKRIAPPDPDE